MNRILPVVLLLVVLLVSAVSPALAQDPTPTKTPAPATPTPYVTATPTPTPTATPKPPVEPTPGGPSPTPSNGGSQAAQGNTVLLPETGRTVAEGSGNALLWVALGVVLVVAVIGVVSLSPENQTK